VRGLLSLDSAAELIERARAEGRASLLEHEGYQLLEVIGVAAPRHRFLGRGEVITEADLSALGGDRLVLKVVAEQVLHKSDHGGVAVVEARPEAVAVAIAEMEEAFQGVRVSGFLLCEHVPHQAGFGDQLLVGLRWTEDFGPVLSLGPGGVAAEFLVDVVEEGQDLAILSPSLASEEAVTRALEAAAVTRLASCRWRGQEPQWPREELVALVQRLLAFAGSPAAAGLAELEINPLVRGPGGPVALDVLVKTAPPRAEALPGGPAAALGRLLRPSSIVVLGVSERPNPGHIIVRNTLAAGFDPDRLWIVKPRGEELLGCRCYPDLASLPEPPDLLILAVAAAQVPELVAEVAGEHRAESMIVIPGGLGEHSDSARLVDGLRAPLLASRETPWGGPVLNGANCLGIRSRPGAYDTLFIPGYKLPVPRGPEAPVALISQSGAFAVARASKLSRLNPRYIVTAGNQLDLTVGDYLQHLETDAEVRVFACYVEGYRPLDGLRFLQAAQRIAASGRTVVLYRAGRTPEGASASASHTASVAGDFVVTRQLAAQAGVIVADTLADFEDLVQVAIAFDRRPLRGRGLGALSNAGFECVAMADNLRGFELADFAPGTRGALEQLFAASRLDGIVEVHNPLDTTPMMADQPFVDAAGAVLADPAVALGLIGCVPLTAAMNSLAPGEHHEDLDRDGSVARGLCQLWAESPKPWAAVVDSGELFDPLASRLLDAGLPTFRTADRALRIIDQYAAAKGL